MKKYGSEKTSLTLSPLAEKVYSGCDVIRIYEDNNKLYTIDDDGVIHSGLSEKEVNEYLEDYFEQCHEPKVIETAQNIIDNGLYETAVSLMDDELREKIHAEISPCTDYQFLLEYLDRHEMKFDEPFTI